MSGGDIRADLCAVCADELFAWWAAAPDNSAAEPVVPSTKPHQRKPINRKRLADIIDQALREQVASSVGAIQLQPSSILNDEIPADALIGIDLRAQRLAKSIEKELL